MVRSRGHKEILSRTEKETLVDAKKDLEQTLKDKREAGIGTAAEQIDEGAIQREIKRIDNAIHDREAPRVRGIEKDRLAKEAQDIERKLQEGMPTKEEMAHPSSNPGAVRKHLNWAARNTPDIERYRYIQKVINPDDPRSVENLRREK